MALPTAARSCHRGAYPPSLRHHYLAGASREQIAAAAQDGYACSIEELEEGLNAIAAPVRDHSAR